MDVHDFEYLVAIADLGSITKAADQLYLTQPAVSKFIHEKEKELGILLFNRAGKQLFPTYAGEKCIEAAREILQINNRLNDDIMMIINNDTSRIRLGFQGTWTKFFFEKIYTIFREYYPSIDLQIYEGNAAESLDKLNNGILDIAIVLTVWEHHAYYTSITVKDQQAVLGVNKNDPVMAKAVHLPDYPYPYLDIQYLKDTPFIMRYTSSKEKSSLVDLLNFHGIKPRIVLETNSRNSTLSAINQGHGVSIVADDATQLYSYENVRFLSITDTNIRRTYLQIIHSKYTRLNPAEEELIDMIINEYE
ncbi:MAG: LysR family transcriptional regulator, partial [Treponema sp.]|nr:LysR family transcriptional regulator [Treponema sp.]